MRVQKVKGKKAIVTFEESGLVRPGDRINVPLDGESSTSRTPTNYFDPHKYGIMASFDLESISYDSDGTDFDVSTVDFEIRFGIIKEKLEFGPIISYYNQSFDFGQGSVDLSSLFFGGYAEYNFQTSDEQFSPSVGGILGYSSSELNNDVSGFRIEPYVRGKYFVKPGSGFCVLGQLGYRYESLSGNGADVTGTGFTLTAGLGYYY